jgi:hypothetical protein
VSYYLPLASIENPSYLILTVVFSITLCILNLVIYSYHYDLNFKLNKKLWDGGIRFAVHYNKEHFCVQQYATLVRG